MIKAVSLFSSAGVGEAYLEEIGIDNEKEEKGYEI